MNDQIPLRMREFNYHIKNLEIEFFGESKIDVFYDDDMLVLEVEKIDNSVWMVKTPWLDENIIKKDQADKLIQYFEERLMDKFNQPLPIVLHPSFFKILDMN